MAKQQLLEGISNEMMKAAQSYVDIRNDIAEAKLELEEAETLVMDLMHKEKKKRLTVTVAGDNYLFEIKEGEEKIRCAKQTKQPAANGQGEFDE